MVISFYNFRGEFTSTLGGDPGFVETTKQLSTDSWVEGDWNTKLFYVLDGMAVPRPENPTTISNEALENVPVPATVIINGVSYETNESRVELGFSQPGTYDVKVVAWPYLDKEFSVENSA
jgi:hypothetical protein